MRVESSLSVIGNSSETKKHMHYLNNTNAYYSISKLNEHQYNQTLPNNEEAVRLSAIVGYLARACAQIREQIPRPRILDVGCGRGWLTNLVSPFGVCVGIEPAGGAVAFARSHFPNVTFFEGTLDTLLESPDFARYNVIICSEVIEHVPREYKPKFIQQIVDCLQKDGSLILTTPRGELFRSWLNSGATPQPIEDWLTEREIVSSFAKGGLRVVEHTRVHPRDFSPRLRLLQDARLHQVLNSVSLSSAVSCLNYMASIYQVWWFRKQG